MAAMMVEPPWLPAREGERLAGLRRYDLLDTPPDGAFDRITALAARLFDVPIAIVSLVDHDRIWFKSHRGLDVQQIGREPGLCASAILQDDPWIVSDATRDPRALANPLVAESFGLRFYAGVPLRTSDGHNLGTLCIIDRKPRVLTADETATLSDLGSMVMSEMELRLATLRALQEAEARADHKDAFVAMLSHELRTPATTIHAAVSMLTRSEGAEREDQLRELLPDIAAESERLVHVLEDLLVLTVLEHGRLEAAQEPLLLQRVLPAVMQRESQRWPDRSVRVDVPDDLPTVLADGGYVEQVIANLFSNAIKYGHPGEVIDVSARDTGAEVEVRVRDHGLIIAPEHRDAVFDLLLRTDQARHKAPGAGIGLYVCRRLLEAMGGRIWLEDGVTGETVFAFALPVIPE
ncbi:GAF domain-containing sensor histidine kinase [soil metagenome]